VGVGVLLANTGKGTAVSCSAHHTANWLWRCSVLLLSMLWILQSQQPQPQPNPVWKGPCWLLLQEYLTVLLS